MSKAIKPMAVAIQAGVPVLVLGAPGIGKTSVTNALAKALNAHSETVIASLREPSDFAGLPIVSNDDVRLAAPVWAKNLYKECKDGRKGILFLDEITTAPPAVQAALLRVVLDRVVGELVLPESVSIAAAANPPEQAAGGWELSPPLANRFCHLRWDVDQTAWVDGMLQGFPAPHFPIVPETHETFVHEMRTTIAGFVRSKPQLLLQLPKNDADAGKPWPSPRSWYMAARLMAATKAAGAGKDCEIALVAGCVGEGVGIEFLNWRNALDLPDPEFCLANPDKFVLPDRGDRAFTVLASIASAAANKMTQQRYLAAWKIFNHAAKAGQKDVAAASVKVLASAGQGKSFLQEKEVREEMKKNLVPFLEILQAAGLA